MWDFGRAELLEPEAIGEPGERMFRLRVMSSSEAASLWMEKEQLAALTLAMRQLLEQTDEEAEAGEKPEAVSPSRAFPEQAEVDFKLGRLGIGYDDRRRMVTIFAYAMDLEEDSPPTFACQISLEQCVTFAERAEKTINAGRPLCILCGVAIEHDGHKCLRRNGHGKLPVSLE